ncbi:MAG: hypothetical protein PHV05_09355, partial [Candidatus Riflebacteria bacterium]|nr:hypothetical protein [Candidatus Riflebacteria bacterium]
YFLSIRSLQDLRKVLIDRVIPLLKEYFYDSWDKICMVLGCPYSDDSKALRNGECLKDGNYIAPIIEARVFEEFLTLGFDHSDYENRIEYTVSEKFINSVNSEDLLAFFLGILPDEKRNNYLKEFEPIFEEE